MLYPIVISVAMTLPPCVFGLAVQILLNWHFLPIICLLSVKNHADPVLVCFRGRSTFMFVDIQI